MHITRWWGSAALKQAKSRWVVRFCEFVAVATGNLSNSANIIRHDFTSCADSDSIGFCRWSWADMRALPLASTLGFGWDYWQRTCVGPDIGALSG